MNARHAYKLSSTGVILQCIDDKTATANAGDMSLFIVSEYDNTLRVKACLWYPKASRIVGFAHFIEWFDKYLSSETKLVFDGTNADERVMWDDALAMGSEW